MAEQEFLTAEEVASLFRVTASTIYEWAAREVLPHVRILAGKRRAVIRFRRLDLQEFIERRTAGPEKRGC